MLLWRARATAFAGTGLPVALLADIDRPSLHDRGVQEPAKPRHDERHAATPSFCHGARGLPGPSRQAAGARWVAFGPRTGGRLPPPHDHTSRLNSSLERRRPRVVSTIRSASSIVRSSAARAQPKTSARGGSNAADRG